MASSLSSQFDSLSEQQQNTTKSTTCSRIKVQSMTRPTGRENLLIWYRHFVIPDLLIQRSLSPRTSVQGQLPLDSSLTPMPPGAFATCLLLTILLAKPSKNKGSIEWYMHLIFG
jgi:hypothetical protein